MEVRFRYPNGVNVFWKQDDWEPFRSMWKAVGPSASIDHTLYSMANETARYASDWRRVYCSLVLTGREWRKLKPLFKALGMEQRSGALGESMPIELAWNAGVVGMASDAERQMAECWRMDPTILDLLHVFYLDPALKADACRVSQTDKGEVRIGIEHDRWGRAVRVYIVAWFFMGDVPFDRNFFFLLLVAGYLEGVVKGLEKHIELNCLGWLYAYAAVLLHNYGTQRVEQRDAEWRALCGDLNSALMAACEHIQESRLEEKHESQRAAAARRVILGIQGVVILLADRLVLDPSRAAEVIKGWELKDKGAINTPLPDYDPPD